MPTTMLIIIWGLFLVISIGMIITGTIKLIKVWDNSKPLPQNKEEIKRIKVKLEQIKRKADKIRDQKNS